MWLNYCVAFVLKVWRGCQRRYRLCMEWTVDLRGLEYSGDKVKEHVIPYKMWVVLLWILSSSCRINKALNVDVCVITKFCKISQVIVMDS